MTRNKVQNTDLTSEEIKEKALNYLEYRAHSRKELFDKLKKFSDADTVNEALDVLEDGGVIDDSVFAFQYAHDAMELRYWGPDRIKRELRLRGIGPDDADDAIERAYEDTGLSPEQMVSDLIGTKYRDYLSDRKNISKAVAGLMRLGYGYGMIKSAIAAADEGARENLYD